MAKASTQLRAVMDTFVGADWAYYVSSSTLVVLPRSSQVPALMDLEALLHLSTLTSVQIGSSVFVCTTFTDEWQHWRSSCRGFFFAVVQQSQGPLYLYILYEDKVMPQASKLCVLLTRKLKDF